MPAPEPLTINNKIIAEINTRLASGLPIQPQDVFWLNRLKQEAKKLMQVNPSGAHIALAAIAHFEWDEQQLREHVRCAGQISSDCFTTIQRAVVMSNFGYVSESYQMIDKIINPNKDDLWDYFPLFCSIGAFKKLITSLERAESMKLNMPNIPVNVIKSANDILTSSGVNEERIAASLDVAGRMLRERRMISAGEMDLSIDDNYGHSPTVFMTIPLCVNADAASEMTFELCENLVRTFPDYSPSLNIGFRTAGIQ